MRVQVDGELIAVQETADWPLVAPLPWQDWGTDGVPRGWAWQALVHGSGDGIVVDGTGTIDGAGAFWWGCAGASKRGAIAAPCSGLSRPPLLRLSGRDVRVDSIRLINSPSWTLHLANASGLVRKVRIENPADAPNTDGIDVDCSQQVVVEDCFIDTGDDALCVKAGGNKRGRDFGVRAEDLLFRRCLIKHGHGISIGSDMSKGVRNVTFEHMRLDGTEIGIRIKSRRGRGGLIEDVTYRNISLENIMRETVQVR